MVAKAIKAMIVEYIRRRNALDRYESKFSYLERGWDEFRTGLRTRGRDSHRHEPISFVLKDLADFHVKDRIKFLEERLDDLEKEVRE